MDSLRCLSDLPFHRIPFTPKPIRTISGFFWNELADSNSNFIVAKIILVEGFDFLVCSKFNHMRTGLYMCMCCGLFAPTQFLSNVVVSLTINDNIYTSFIGDVEKHETIVEGQRRLEPNIMESV